jgi:hydrogenase/urease accessory protein HupE
MRALLAIALVLFAISLSAGARAHAVGVSKGEYSVRPGAVDVVATFARGEFTGDGPGVAGPDGGEAARKVTSGIAISADGEPCVSQTPRFALTEQDGIEIRATYACRADAVKYGVALRILDNLPHGHRHVAHASSGSYSFQEVCYRGHAEIEIPAPSDSARATGTGSGAGSGTGVVGFVRMGIEHILTGYDHLLFLFGLIVVGGRLRALALVVTAFTVAHSITLGLAATGVWTPSPRVVEPMIALSIAYVGVENFFVRSAENRWRITFPFGLIHGFGFAGALREIHLGRAEIPRALVGFNLGVEIGQLAVMAVLLPIVLRLRKSPWFTGEPERRVSGVQVLSGAVALLGVIWLVERLA